jgi:hypothetical protein
MTNLWVGLQHTKRGNDFANTFGGVDSDLRDRLIKNSIEIVADLKSKFDSGYSQRASFFPTGFFGI